MRFGVDLEYAGRSRLGVSGVLFRCLGDSLPDVLGCCGLDGQDFGLAGRSLAGNSCICLLGQWNPGFGVVTDGLGAGDGQLPERLHLAAGDFGKKRSYRPT
jgi:hypothetical protein